LNPKSAIKRLLPPSVLGLYTRYRNEQIQRSYESLSRAEAFEKIYASAVWGGEATDGTASSGSGSRGRYISEYSALLKHLLQAHKIASVADLGCGDFEVGKIIAGMVEDYTGVDIAQSMVDRNTRLHSSDRVHFVRADLASDPLPPAGAALVRQVLQHLSNSEIQAALANILKTYPLVFITEHVYTGPGGVPNRDMPHGPGTRVPLRSGVFIDQPPFNLRAEFVSDISCAPNEVLRTWATKFSSGPTK